MALNDHRRPKMTPVTRARLEALVSEAERAFRNQPKALWSDRTYLAPKDAKMLREMLDSP